MSSQINPIIAAFLQASAQAEEQVQSIQQHKILSERLALEKEANDAEAKYRQGQLQNFIAKLQFDADQAEVKNQLEADRNNISGMRLGMEMVDKNLIKDPKMLALLPKSIAEQIKDYGARKEEETKAKAEQIAALAGPQADAEALKRGKIAEIEQPFKVDLQKIKDTAALERQKAASDAAYDRAIAVADKNIAARIAAAKIKANAPQKQAATKITAGERQKMIDLDVAEGLFNKLEEALKDDKKASFFVGQAGSAVRSLGRKFGKQLSPEHATMESVLSDLTMTIGNPRFGASFTAGEERILKGAVPSMYGDIKPAEAKAKVAEALATIRERKAIMADVYGFEKATSLTPTKSNLDNLLKKYGSK